MMKKKVILKIMKKHRIKLSILLSQRIMTRANLMLNKHMEIRLDSDVKEELEMHNVVIIVRSIFRISINIIQKYFCMNICINQLNKYHIDFFNKKLCQQDKIVDYDLRKIAINNLLIQTIQLVLFLRSYSLKRKLVANDTV